MRVHYDQRGNTLTVWFAEPRGEQICEETGDEVILMKDTRGRVIGFEKLNFLPSPLADVTVVVTADALGAESPTSRPRDPKTLAGTH